MGKDTLSNLIYSAKSVFHPRSENDLRSFEKYIYDNYLSDVEECGGGSELETPEVEIDKRSKRKSMFELSRRNCDVYSVEFKRATSRE